MSLAGPRYASVPARGCQRWDGGQPSSSCSASRALRFRTRFWSSAVRARVRSWTGWSAPPLRPPACAYAYSQLAMWALSSAPALSSSWRSRSVIELLKRVLGDQRVQVGDLLAHRLVLRMIADAAAVPHRERVLPRVHQGLELGAQGFEIHPAMGYRPQRRNHQAVRGS